MGLLNSVKGSLQGISDRRRAPRLTDPLVIAYYWNGAEPVPYHVRDMSRTGAYICTPDRWYLGTIVQLTLNADRRDKAPSEADAPVPNVTLWSKVIRYGPDGIGMEFMSVKGEPKKKLDGLLADARSSAEEKNED